MPEPRIETWTPTKCYEAFERLPRPKGSKLKFMDGQEWTDDPLLARLVRDRFLSGGSE